MDDCGMTVVIQNHSYQALTPPSVPCMTSLTSILLVNFVTKLVFTFPLDCNRKKITEFIGRLAVCFGISTFRLVRTTLAHAPMNFCISQFCHQNQGKADT